MVIYSYTHIERNGQNCHWIKPNIYVHLIKKNYSRSNANETDNRKFMRENYSLGRNKTARFFFMYPIIAFGAVGNGSLNQ